MHIQKYLLVFLKKKSNIYRYYKGEEKVINVKLETKIDAQIIVIKVIRLPIIHKGKASVVYNPWTFIDEIIAQ
jgi:hypothetical protein